MGLYFLSQTELSVFLLHEELLALGDLKLGGLEETVGLLSAHLGVEQAVFHDGDVLLEGGEVLVQGSEFFVLGGDGVLGVV